MATITIADYLAQILEAGGGRQQGPRRQPTSADWAEGIDPTTLGQRPFGAGGPVDFGPIGAAAEQLEYGLAYGDLPGQLEQAALYSDPTALAGLTMRGRPGEPGLQDIAGQLGIPGRVRDPRVVDAFDRVIEACRKHGKTAGSTTTSADDAKELMRRGIRFFGCGVDYRAVRNHLIHVRESFSEAGFSFSSAVSSVRGEPFRKP